MHVFASCGVSTDAEPAPQSSACLRQDLLAEKTKSRMTGELVVRPYNLIYLIVIPIKQ